MSPLPRSCLFVASTTYIAGCAMLACTLARPLDYLTEGSGGEGGAADATAVDGSSPPIPQPDPDAGYASLAQELFNPTRLTQDRDNLYWYNGDGAIMTVPKRGGPVRTIATRSPPTTLGALAADPDPASGLLFIAIGDVITRVPKITNNGTLSDEIGRQTPAPTAMIADDTHLFVLSTSETEIGILTRMNKDGSNRVTFSDIHDDPYGVALEGDNLLWPGTDQAGAGVAVDVPKAGAPPDAGARNAHSSTAQDVLPDSPRVFAADRDAVYWMEGNIVSSLPRAGNAGAVTKVYTGPAHDGFAAYHLAVDGKWVFVLDTVDATLVQVPRTGGADIREPVKGTIKTPTSFVVDNEAIYIAIQKSPTGKEGLIARVEKLP